MTPSHPGRPPMVAPEHQVPVGVGVFTDPDVPLVEEGHNFTILVHAQDFSRDDEVTEETPGSLENENEESPDSV